MKRIFQIDIDFVVPDEKAQNNIVSFCKIIITSNVYYENTLKMIKVKQQKL